jgi:hypothetical protein
MPPWARRVEIKVVRHRETSAGNRLSWKISPQAKMLLGIFCRGIGEKLQARHFRIRHCTEEGTWERVRGDCLPGLVCVWAMHRSRGETKWQRRISSGNLLSLTPADGSS